MARGGRREKWRIRELCQKVNSGSHGPNSGSHVPKSHFGPPWADFVKIYKIGPGSKSARSGLATLWSEENCSCWRG